VTDEPPRNTPTVAKSAVTTSLEETVPLLESILEAAHDAILVLNPRDVRLYGRVTLRRRPTDSAAAQAIYTERAAAESGRDSRERL